MFHVNRHPDGPTDNTGGSVPRVQQGIYTISEISKSASGLNTLTFQPPSIDIGGRCGDARMEPLGETVNSLKEKLQERSKRVFEIEWAGHHIPRGAKVLGHEIQSTNNGMVISVIGQIIGTYERLIRNGGPNRDQHKIQVFLDPQVEELKT